MAVFCKRWVYSVKICISSSFWAHLYRKFNKTSLIRHAFLLVERKGRPQRGQILFEVVLRLIWENLPSLTNCSSLDATKSARSSPKSCIVRRPSVIGRSMKKAQNNFRKCLALLWKQRILLCIIKFMFSKTATKNCKIFTIHLTLNKLMLNRRWIFLKFFVPFLENMNITIQKRTA